MQVGSQQPQSATGFTGGRKPDAGDSTNRSSNANAIDGGDGADGGKKRFIRDIGESRSGPSNMELEVRRRVGILKLKF